MLLTTRRAKALMNAVRLALLPRDGFWTRPDGWAYHGYLCGHIWVWPCGRQWLVDIDSVGLPPHIEVAVRAVLPELWQEEPTDAPPLPLEAAPSRARMEGVEARGPYETTPWRRTRSWKDHRQHQYRC